jgi:hypothetical protein
MWGPSNKTARGPRNTTQAEPQGGRCRELQMPDPRPDQNEAAALSLVRRSVLSSGRPTALPPLEGSSC